MTTQADRAIGALRTGYDQLATLVGRLRPDDLVRPSGAAEWTVAQVLSHLGSGAEINLAVVEGAIAGTGNPGAEFNQATWARWDAMTPADQATSFLAANEKLLQLFEGLDEQQVADLRIDFGFFPQPLDVGAAAAMRLTEFALHSWDVRVAFDADATVAPEATELLADAVGSLLGFAGKADQLDGDVTLAVETTEPARTFGLAITDTVAVTETSATADGVLVVPTEYFVRLVTGRHGAKYTPASVELTSAKVTLDDLRRVFPGY
ncbi:uncharacterized protein (TIGR03083 family) [Kribbella amoyensis]|uniref:Uncharacterized protein (TIGR03083 family) n=1 Tax=Kribbella amoyensis TaxID=996641 RepID=A0A561C0S1_9ACTN|nr:maleylpyruvate isomerase family mycothiol-dependent enzyme [Kribbella amoyensis]TWD84745.1 uncharacterized protein (TIGR03083 family) [Kribbella amoyensis]